MSKRLAPFYKRASSNMDEVSDHTSVGTPYSFVSCPLAVITREPLPQCAVDRGLPAVYCARLYPPVFEPFTMTAGAAHAESSRSVNRTTNRGEVPAQHDGFAIR